MTSSHSSMVMLTSIRSRRMPALFTSTSSPPKVVDRRFDQAAGAVAVRHVLAVGDRLAAEAADLLDDLARRPSRAA